MSSVQQETVSNLQQLPSVPISLDEKTHELQLAPIELKAPIYRYRQLPPYAGTNAPVLSTSVTQVQWQVSGNKVFNLHKSYISFDALFAAPGVNLVTNVFTDCLPCDSIQYTVDNTKTIADISQAYIYTKVAPALALDMDDYQTRGPVYGDTAIGTAYPISQLTGCQPASGYFSQNLTASTTVANIAAGALVATVSAANQAAGFINGQAIAVTAGNPVPLTIVQPNFRTSQNLLSGVPSDAYMVDNGANPHVMSVSANPPNQTSGTDCAGKSPIQRLVSSGVNTAMTIRYRVPLKAFVGTLFALDKDLHFGTNTQLYYNFPDYRVFGFASQIDGNTGAAEIAAPTISNLYLYLAEDVNEENIANLKSALNSGGIKMACPYTIYKQYTIPAASTAGTISQTLTKGMGLALKRALTIPHISGATLNQRCNTFNVGGVKFNQAQSMLNGNPLQDYKLATADSSLWNYFREYIRQSPAGQSQRTFEESCFFLDNWSDASAACWWYENDSKLSGMSLDNDSTYEVNFYKTTAGAIALAQYQTWARILIIKKDGLAWGRADGSASGI